MKDTSINGLPTSVSFDPNGTMVLKQTLGGGDQIIQLSPEASAVLVGRMEALASMGGRGSTGVAFDR